MPFRQAIARLAVADARRFEIQTVSMLREILSGCDDAATRTVLEEIIAEEEAHCRILEEAARGRDETGRPPAPEEKKKLPEAPDMSPPRDASVSGALRAVLRKERASVTFYELLAERTPVPAVRDIFRQIAEVERMHARKLAAHIRRICGQDEENRPGL